MFTESGSMKMQLAFCWAFAYSHWISIFTHDSAFVTCTPRRGLEWCGAFDVTRATIIDNVSRNRTDGNISRRRRKKYSSSFVGWYALIQKCLGWQCVTLTSLENFTHKTFYSDLVGKSADDEGSGFSLFFPRLSAHVLSANVRHARDKYIHDSTKLAIECPFQWLW